MNRGKRWIIGVAMSVLLHVASSVAANKCVDAKGRVSYQDTACENAAAVQRPVDTSDALSTKTVRPTSGARSDSRSSVGDSAYANAHGEWRGPAQFQLTVGGVRDGAAQLVTPMVIELKENGEIVGVIPAVGCKLSGLATQFVAEYMASVDVSLKGCRDERFNTRFSGHLTASKASKEAKLNLSALVVQRPSGKFQQNSVEAVLKR